MSDSDEDTKPLREYDEDGNPKEENAFETMTAPITDDDLLGQAIDAGKATLEMGKKTGKLAFNLARKALTWASQNISSATTNKGDNDGQESKGD